jgi:HEPN domain-containing protein
LGTAEAMFQTRRYIYTIFMCHLSLEKALKRLMAGHGKVPLKSHDLIFLLDRIGLDDIPEQHLDFLEMINNVSVPTRYPDELDRLINQYPRKRTAEILRQCQEIYKWLKNYLKT